jgi:hypothetical protein
MAQAKYAEIANRSRDGYVGARSDLRGRLDRWAVNSGHPAAAPMAGCNMGVAIGRHQKSYSALARIAGLPKPGSSPSVELATTAT